MVELDEAAGTIVAVSPTSGPVPDRVLVPGLVDLQVNGAGPVDVASARSAADWVELERRLLAQGVTSWCPTLVSAPLERYAERLAAIEAARRRHPTIVGAHLEGPFLGGAPGAHRRECVVPVDPAWLRSLPPVVRVLTIAPELAGAPAAVAELAERGVLVALGHSTATPGEVAASVAAGARLVTHLFNGMAPLHHRAPGLVGAALATPELATSLIADGVHVDPLALRVAFLAKGPGRVVLVSDQVAVGGRLRVEGGAARLPDGTLAGAVVGLDAALGLVVQRAGIPLVDAVAAASSTPAALLGLADRGRLAVGARADVAALDARSLAAVATWVAGRQVAG